MSRIICTIPKTKFGHVDMGWFAVSQLHTSMIKKRKELTTKDGISFQDVIAKKVKATPHGVNEKEYSESERDITKVMEGGIVEGERTFQTVENGHESDNDNEGQEKDNENEATNAIKFSRAWAMPNSATFEMSPVCTLLQRYVNKSTVVIDPFARNSSWGTITNDLNPKTKAKYHMDSVEFLDKIIQENGNECIADVALFDPPYSPRQISECYKNIGRKAHMKDTQNGRLYKECKDRLAVLLKPGGVAISFGWNSAGFGKSRGFEILEIMLIAHGGAHNDTIVTVERKL